LESWHSLTPFFSTIPLEPTGDERTPFWLNGWFPILDPISLCALLVHRRPCRYIEIGSGNSTKFARKAIDAFDLGTQVISIDPQPRAETDELCDQVLRIPAEDLPTSFIEAIGADDMLFIDNSHRAFPNSDVTVFFLEVLPGCQPELCMGFMIFLAQRLSNRVAQSSLSRAVHARCSLVRRKRWGQHSVPVQFRFERGPRFARPRRID
jgi:hypothetical protein